MSSKPISKSPDEEHRPLDDRIVEGLQRSARVLFSVVLFLLFVIALLKLLASDVPAVALFCEQIGICHPGYGGG